MSEAKMIKMENNQPQKDLKQIPPEFFEKLIDNTGKSVAEYNKDGLSVLLFFIAEMGCPICQEKENKYFLKNFQKNRRT